MGAKWISIEKRSERSALYLFKKEFYVDSAIKSFKVKFSADTRYRLYINGKEFSHGPCQSSPFVKYFEEVECAGGLKVGKNEICISVFHAADPFHFGTMPRRDKPALYFAGVLSTEKEETVL